MTDNEIQYRTASQCASTEYCRGWNDASMEAEKIIAIKNDEIDRLKIANQILSINADNVFQEGLNEARDLYDEQIKKQAKSEAIKEFAERLKAIASQGFWEADGYVGAEQIDDLIKEMAGEE